VYRITFVVDALRNSRPTDPLANKAVGDMLTALTLIDADYLRANRNIPSAEDATRSGVVRVAPLPAGTEDWQDIPTTLGVGRADRRDLACWLAAEETVRGRRSFPKMVRWPTSHRITYCIDLFKGKHEQELSHKALEVLLWTLMRIDENYLRANPRIPPLYDSGVRYEEEPVGQEDWQDIPTTLRMGIGDCEDLACWRAAEYRVRFGIDARPMFTYKLRSNGSYLYHITVRLPDGRTEDPSRRLGMR
jgi:hypothetical protein